MSRGESLKHTSLRNKPGNALNRKSRQSTKGEVMPSDKSKSRNIFMELKTERCISFTIPVFPENCPKISLIYFVLR